MNFDEAIAAHVGWKTKLKRYIANPDKSLNHETVCKDNLCDLGKWIYGEGVKHANATEYPLLKQSHADFHKEAAKIIQNADAGQNMQEEIQLGSKSVFDKLSNDVVALIMKIRRNV